MKGFLYKDEVFPSPLTQICLQFKGMLNVDWTSPLWVLDTINSILLLYSAWFHFLRWMTLETEISRDK